MLNVLSLIGAVSGLGIGLVSISEVASNKAMIEVLLEEVNSLEDKIILRNDLIEEKSKELSQLKQKHKQLETVSDFREMTVNKLYEINCNLVTEKIDLEKDNERLGNLVDNLKNELGFQGTILEERDDRIDKLIRENIDQDNIINDLELEINERIDLIKELTIENKGLKEVIERQDKRLANYDTKVEMLNSKLGINNTTNVRFIQLDDDFEMDKKEMA